MSGCAPTSTASQAEAWRRYLLENIPPQFGLIFNTVSWNQGFVVTDRHMFLLVTLEKGSLNQDHQYDNRFHSADRFQWQSQNRTKRDSRHGRLIANHRQEGMEVHLFVRRHKVLDGKAAPFVYCGTVGCVSWNGDAPITVEWKLREPVPQALHKALDVPAPATH